MAHSEQDLELLLDLIQRCDYLARRIEMYETDEAAYEDDIVVMDSIIFGVVAMGATASKLSPQFRESHPELHCTTIEKLSEEAIVDSKNLNFKLFLKQARIKAPVFRKRLVAAIIEEFNYTPEDIASANTSKLFTGL